MGNHVMQALPLLAWLLMRHRQRLQHVTLTTTALVWTAITMWLLQRALGTTGFL
jgi:hypothetical protein